MITALSQHPHNIMIIIFPVLLLLTSGFVVEIFGLLQAVSSVCFPTFLHFTYVISQYRFKSKLLHDNKKERTYPSSFFTLHHKSIHELAEYN